MSPRSLRSKESEERRASVDRDADVYRDPRLVADIRDVTQAVRKDYDQSKPRVLVPGGGALTFNYSVDTLGNADALSVLPALLNSYHLSGNPGVFRLLRTGTMFHVIPAMSNNAQGALESRQSLLDVSITVDNGNGTALQALENILGAVSQSTRTSVTVGTVPLNLLVQTKVNRGAVKESARAVLMRTLAATNRALSWRLLCQPRANSCAFNVHVVESPK